MASREDDDQKRQIRTCVTMDVHRELAAISPEYRSLRRQFELETREWLRRYSDEGLRTGVVRIPVVVHVVWNTAAQNVSDAQIASQIEVLNRDFRRTNADAMNVPMRFAGRAADARIEFGLARRDPNCGMTTGITRTQTTTTGFTEYTIANIQSAATGGADPWPRDRYLNMWVAPFSDGTLGWGAFPGTPAARDGVVIATTAFGTLGTAVPRFNGGRTATHEVGHWLNLLHIWADDQRLADNCSRSDECADTPNQAVARTGSPSGVLLSCGNGPDGDMYMNYMDYVDDAAMFMFTHDQVARMHASLSVARSEILGSDGLVPVGAGLPVSDLWMQDTGDDTGDEPNPSGQPMYLSDDIWVRNAPDGLTNQDHQNPRGDQPNVVYIRVRNRGCPGGAPESGTLRLYWAKASPALSWPAPWDGSVTAPATMGGAIGSQAVLVPPGTTQIYSFPWTPPDPSDYAAFGADRAHFCLLARIETDSAPPFGMTFPETGNLYANVQNNNNIAWKNVTIVDIDGDGGRFADLVIGHFGDEWDRETTRLIFRTPKDEALPLFDWGHLLVEFRGEAVAEWMKGKVEFDGMERLHDGRLLVFRPEARLWGIGPKPGLFGTMHVRFVPNGRQIAGARVFELDVLQVDPDDRPIGGQRFLLKTVGPRQGAQETCVHLRFDGVDWVGSSKECGCC